MRLTENLDYKRCITNFTSSIMKYFGLEPFYNTIEDVDVLLNEKKYQNVVIFLCDGMGNNVLKANTNSSNFLRTHTNLKMRSTFPSTTANCTTAFTTGLNPITTGWLGWSTYYRDLDVCVDNFPNTESLSKKVILGDNIAERKMPLKRLGNIIEEKTDGEIKYYTLLPFGEGHYHSLKDLEHRLIKLCNEPGRKYIYAYYENPDKVMHQFGIYNDTVKSELSKISRLMGRFERKTKDSICFVTADHGHINVSPIALPTFYDVMDCLSFKGYSCDARCPMFFVKEDRKEDFVTLFNKYFGEDYDLYTKEEILENHIFGIGTPYADLDNIIGDYMAIAKTNRYFMLTNDSYNFKGHHASMTNEETSIPLIVFKN